MSARPTVFGKPEMSQTTPAAKLPGGYAGFDPIQPALQVDDLRMSIQVRIALGIRKAILPIILLLSAFATVALSTSFRDGIPRSSVASTGSGFLAFERHPGLWKAIRVRVYGFPVADQSQALEIAEMNGRIGIQGGTRLEPRYSSRLVLDVFDIIKIRESDGHSPASGSLVMEQVNLELRTWPAFLFFLGSTIVSAVLSVKRILSRPTATRGFDVQPSVRYRFKG
jgi:hypothetical protein